MLSRNVLENSKTNTLFLIQSNMNKNKNANTWSKIKYSFLKMTDNFKFSTASIGVTTENVGTKK